MKRFLILLLAIGLLVTGCKKNDKPAPSIESHASTTNKTSTSVTDIKPIQEISVAPTIEIKEEAIKTMRDMVFKDIAFERLIEFVQNSVEGAEQDKADKLFLILESIQSAWLGYYKSSMDFDFKDISDTENNLLKEIKKNGLRLITINGSKIPAIDYGVYWDNRRFLSDWFTQYIEIARAESNEPAVWNGKLNISYEELENRILLASDYLEKYPLSIRINEVIRHYEDYIFTYFYGYEPDSTYDISTNRVSKDSYERYKKFASKNTGTTAAKLVIEYINLIEKGKLRLTTEIMSFLEGTFSTLNDQRIFAGNDIGKKIVTERVEKLLPEKTGFAWKCFGFAEYCHDCVLSSIQTEEDNPVYVVTGKVDDLSGGMNSEENLSIYLQYRIENNVLTQSKDAPLMMDSDFNNIELIRYPFVVGHKWIQYPVDDKGNTYSIETEIISISQEDGDTVYEVEYREMPDGKNENRLIQTGKSTIAFTKLYDDHENEPFLIGYTIYEEQTGYLNP